MTWRPNPFGHLLSVCSGNRLTGWLQMWILLPLLSLKGFWKKQNNYEGHGRGKLLDVWVDWKLQLFQGFKQLKTNVFVLLVMLTIEQDMLLMVRTGSGSCWWRWLEASVCWQICKLSVCPWHNRAYIQGFEILPVARSVNPRHWIPHKYCRLACIPVYSEPLFMKASDIFSPFKTACEAIQGLNKNYTESMARGLSGPLLNWPLRSWVFQKAWAMTTWRCSVDPESRKWARSRVKIRPESRRAARTKGGLVSHRRGWLTNNLTPQFSQEQDIPVWCTGRPGGMPLIRK